jgi:hypothetical protein
MYYVSCWFRCPETGTSSAYGAKLVGFFIYLRKKAELNIQNVVLNESRKMDNV